MKASFDFGMIGIGVMGSNLLLNMADHGHDVIGFDLKQERADQLEAAAASGSSDGRGKVKGTISITEMVAALKTPRKIMMLVPAGKPVDDVIENLLPHLEKNDILIDGGNSYYKDTNRRIGYLQAKGIHFFGMGVSGGEMGARTGPSMMPGGDKDAYRYLRPILEDIAAKAEGEPCVAYMGNHASGHYVKMVHNGIEYAMMQLISETYDLLHRAGGYTNEQLQSLFSAWNEGQLQGYLIQVTADVFRAGDTETADSKDFLVDKILDQAGSKGTGKWTSQEAMDLPVAIPTIDAAVAARNLSVYKEQRTRAAKLYRPKTGKIEVDGEVLAHLENTLAFCFVIAYSQGLSMLAKASTELQMNIPLPDVIKVWKAGCIIRSALLGNFAEAFQKDPNLPSLLLDADMATLMKNREESARYILALGIQARIPLAAMSSALSYYDNYLSERMPTNLIQAQRDYFGAHTYRRIDKEGVFHTEWNAAE
ncbi:MAG TPA: NADP-dependent phosphogluconate dehydrogenase [Flavisolibacter sp.]|nr:NADP-dependent phosphogluconate dehydrogenase [Flavisolibacter sp.]